MKSITPKRVTVFLLPILLFLGSASALSSREYSILSELQTTLGGVFDFSISRNEVTVPLDNQAVVSTDKLDYRPGEIVRISGDGFFPGEQVRLQVNYKMSLSPTVNRTSPGVASGHDPWDVTADFAGRISAQWLVEEDSRDQTLELTADGLQSGYHAETIFTDAQGGGIGADKAVYRLDSGIWSTGNAGDTVEGQWVPYQYVLENIDPNEPLPNFRITYPLFIDGNDAMYFDGVSNLRYCIDNGDTACDPQGGSTPGSLPDGTPRPPTSITRWIPFQVTTVNAPYPPGSCTDPANPIPGGVVGTTAPCELRYFQVTPGTNGVPSTIGTASRITFFFEFHLAQTPLWVNGLQANFEPGEANAIPTHPDARPLNVTYGFNIYNTWTNDFFGAGIASIGSSQHVNFQDAVANGDQGVPSGAITLPVPTVDITSDSTVSGVKFEDIDGDGVKDPGEPGLAGWQITLAGTLLGGTPVSFPTVTAGDGSYSFPQIFPGTYTIVETPQAGFQQTAPNNTGATVLPNGSPNPPGVTHTGGTYNLNIPDGTAALYANIDFGNRRPLGHIIVDKVTVPAGDPQSFDFDASGGSYADFSLTHAAAPNDQTLVAGNYSVSETVPSGWDLTSSPCVSSIGDTETIGALELDAGETITCTFTNTKRGHIIVDKVTVPAGDPQSFNFDASGGFYADFSLTHAAAPNDQTLVPGNYSVSETVPSGWDLTSNPCVSSIGDTETIGALELDAGETITCTFTNTKRGHIIVDKVTVPAGDPQSFNFDAGGGSYGDFSLTHAADPNDQTLVPGNYSVSETVPSGWDLTSSPCVSSIGDTESPAALELDAGETITCTFTNTKRGHVIVDKVTVPAGDPQSFNFDAGGGSYGDFSLTDAAPPNDQTLVAGNYSVSETVPGGWDLTSSPCVSSIGDTESPAALELDAGETITCTFTNTKRGHIIVDKVTVPAGDPQSFNFDAGGGSYGDFSLTHAAPPNDQTLVAGNYSVSETVPSGWDLTSSPCVSSIGDTETAAALELDAGETITCTFTNTKRGHIVVDKVTVPAGDPQSFNFDAGGGSYGDFSLTHAAAPNDQTLVPGNYSVSETVPSGWDLTSSPCVSSIGDTESPAALELDAGETITCTFTNTKRGHIVVDKITVPAGDPQSFNFDAGGGSYGDFSLTHASDPNDQTLVPGNYSVSETVPSGWDLTSSPCVSSIGDTETIGALELDAGETITCTFTNTKRGHIIVDKVTVPAGDPQSFNFDAGGGSYGDFSLTDAAPPNDQTLVAGNYSVSETVPSGWDLTSSPCVSSIGDTETAAALELDAGETITCTFTNTKRGHIIVDKITDPAGDPQSFNFDAGGGSYVDFSLTHAADPNDQTLAAGNYSVSETVPAGWDLTSSPCVSSIDDTETAGALELDPGETITCTFTNTKRGKIIIDKVTNPAGDSQTFSFDAAGGTYADFSLADADAPNEQTLPPGAYSVTEGSLPNWDLTGISCSDPSGGTSTNVPLRSVNIGLAAGETVSCTFTNTKKGAIKIVKNTVGGDGTFNFTPSNFGSGSFNLVTSGGTQSTTFNNVGPINLPGFYTIVENTPTGWDLVSFTCDNGTPDGGILVAPGQTTTCTATNRKRGSIKIIKDALPDSDQDFTFTPSGFNGDANFILDDDADNTRPSNMTFSNLVPGGSYSVVEAVTPLWQLSNISCQSVGGTNNNTTNLGTRSVAFNLEAGEEITCTFRNINVVGFVTSSSLCTFDVDPDRDGNQFRLLFTPDNSVSLYKLNASNPGQYYYNVLHYSDPANPNDNTVTMNIPFPFITHGATPVHVYSSVTATTQGGQTCLVPGDEYSNQQTQITFGSYPTGGNLPILGVTTVPVAVTVPDGFSYVNIHLDYGLKRTTGYTKGGGGNDAMRGTPTPLLPNIPDLTDYTFSNGGTHTVESVNSFKKNPGAGGLFRTPEELAIPNQEVLLQNQFGDIVGSPGISDEDGWYFIPYKHTGKQATFTLVWVGSGQRKQVLMKANSMVQVDFP